ncbi:MAG: type II toxin-antitoxin system Phd/YefM family antitoxin [Chloroflexi bacterium]|nr:type II toxin-antitoxin system Phd/YefM family antitoxin [Chloroflexota bacterium]
MGEVKVVPISEARARLTTLVDEVARGQETYFIASRSRVKAVLLGADAYNTLVDRLEDLEDSLEILKARLANEPTRPLEEFVQEPEASMTIKERLHRLVDELPEREVQAAERYLEYLRRVGRGPVLRALLDASEDDEPETEDER